MKEERRMILQMIEDGKITTDEGIALLEALEKSQGEDHAAKKAESSTFESNANTQDENVSNQSFDHSDKGFNHANQSNNTAFEDLSHAAKRIGEEMYTHSKTVGNKLGDLVERFISKVKDIDLDFDFSFANMPKVEKVLVGTPPMSGIIDLTTVNGKVEITGWDQPEYRIEISGAIRAEDQIEANAILNEILHFEETPTSLTLGVEQRRGTKLSLEVYLPKQLLNDLKVKTSNGSIEIENMNLDGAKLETNNGAINLERIQSSGLYCETSNGRITIEDGDVDELYAKTSNGQVRVEGTMSKVKCYTSNGSIRYTLHEAREGELDFDTTNGSIEVKLPIEGLAVNGELSTSFGSLDCTLPKMEITSASKEIAHRHLRFKSTDDPGTRFAVKCKTTNGGIRINPLSE